MTAQFPNTVILKEEKFSIAGFSNEGLITPEDFGIKPIVSSTACWRGFITTYRIDDKANFILENLKVKTEPEDTPVEINGIEPRSAINKFEKLAFNRIYKQINLQVEYTGFILIGKDFVRELYVHMGFHKAWKYEIVYEIEIYKGKVKSITDLSEKMAGIRNAFKERKKENKKSNSPGKDEISEWVEKSFNQKYQKE